VYCGLAFLIPYPKCEDTPGWVAQIIATGDTVRAWRKGGGSRGYWMLSNMAGTFNRNSNGGYSFKVESLTVLRRVKPYEISK